MICVKLRESKEGERGRERDKREGERERERRIEFGSYSQCWGSKTIFSDPHPTWSVISDPDPDPALGSFRI